MTSIEAAEGAAGQATAATKKRFVAAGRGQRPQAGSAVTLFQRGFDGAPFPQIVLVGKEHRVGAMNEAARSLWGGQLQEREPLAASGASDPDVALLVNETWRKQSPHRLAARAQGGGARPAPAGEPLRLQDFDLCAAPWQVDKADADEAGVVLSCIDARRAGAVPTAAELADEAARSAFTDGVAHDLRGPLTAVRLVLERLCGGHPPAERGRCCRALHALQRADDLLENLLDASSVQAGKELPIRKVVVDLVPPFRRLLSELRDSNGRTIHFRHDAIVRGLLDPRLLTRVLQNLVQNAIAYGDPGRPIEVYLCQRNVRGHVELRVRNFGPTMAPAEQARILGRFQRGLHATLDNGHRPGWGLGLMVVQAVAQAHGGQLQLSSADDVTEFVVDLPG